MTAVLPAQWVDALENTPVVREWTEKRLRRGLLRLVPKPWVREGIALDQHIREGRFQRSLALIAGGSALLGGLEVSYEHIRGSYSQRVMYTLSCSVARCGRGRLGRLRPPYRAHSAACRLRCAGRRWRTRLCLSHPWRPSQTGRLAAARL